MIGPTDKNISSYTDLTNIIHIHDLMDTCRTLNPIIGDYTFSSNTHGIFIKIKYALCHKPELIKCARIGTILETEAAEKLND